MKPILNHTPRYLVIEGNIGVGKTSLARKLAADLDGDLLLEEFAENSFLPRFYEDPERYSFPLELSFLAARYRQLTRFFEQPRNFPVVSDYHFVKSLLFARNNLQAPERALYESFYEMMSDRFPEPDLVVYLDNNIPQLQENIRKRGRGFEQHIHAKYLENIRNEYEKLLELYPFKRLLRIPAESLDFINNESDYLFIINKLNDT